MSVGLLLVSHLKATAEGVRQLCQQLAGQEVCVAAVGGVDEPGVSLEAITRALGAMRQGGCNAVVAIGDLGSSVILLDQCADVEPELSLMVVDAPFLEGAVAAAMAIAVGSSLADAAQAAEAAYQVRKR
jgi:PTS hybrid protein